MNDISPTFRCVRKNVVVAGVHFHLNPQVSEENEYGIGSSSKMVVKRQSPIALLRTPRVVLTPTMKVTGIINGRTWLMARKWNRFYFGSYDLCHQRGRALLPVARSGPND